MSGMIGKARAATGRDVEPVAMGNTIPQVIDHLYLRGVVEVALALKRIAQG